MIDDTDATVKQLNTLFRNLDRRFAGENGLVDRASKTLGDYDELAKNLNGTNQQVQAVIKENRPAIREFGQRTLSQLNDLINETRQFVSGMTRLADEIERNPARFFFGNRGQGYKP